MSAEVLAVLAATETEALDWLDMRDEFGGTMPRWASDRLRLCARDRAVLERHRADESGGCTWCIGDASSDFGHEITFEYLAWPCPDAQAVIAYWQGETP